MIKEFLLPKQIIVGPGSLNKLGEAVKGMGKKALVVSDSVVGKLGYLDRVKATLAEVGIEMAIYDQVNEEPLTTHIADGTKVLKENNCDLVVAIGGGSPIDAAKAIALMGTNPGTIVDYQGSEKAKEPKLPLVAIPTTAGTASEVTGRSIITDPETSVKMVIASRNIIPDVAICDAELTMTMPQSVTASTGVDALTHAIESYISTVGNTLTDDLALSAIRLIGGNLRQAWSNGKNAKARENMMLGQLIAGMSFANAAVALVHGMARPVGAYFHVAHGISNAVLLPHVMRFSMIGNPEKFANIAVAMGEDITGLSTLEAAELGCDAVEALCHDLNIPSFQEMGLDEEKYFQVAEQMAKDAIASGSPSFNPRIATVEEIVELYRVAYYGA